MEQAVIGNNVETIVKTPGIGGQLLLALMANRMEIHKGKKVDLQIGDEKLAVHATSGALSLK